MKPQLTYHPNLLLCIISIVIHSEDLNPGAHPLLVVDVAVLPLLDVALQVEVDLSGLGVGVGVVGVVQIAQ